MTKNHDPAGSLSNRDSIRLAQIAIRRWGELILEELQRDLVKFESLHEFEQTYLRAYWCQLAKDLLRTRQEKQEVPVSSAPELEKQAKTIEGYFGISLDPKRPDPILKNDIAKRLGQLKNQLVHEFESGVLSTIAAHEISSPIEQIFLMEWRFSRAEERFRLQLRPQQPIRTDSGTYFLDYCITAIDNPASRFSVAIELDGHEFHEKTPEQATNDKRRERAILRAGAPNGLVVFRFTGSEIFRDCKACVKEIVDYIEQRALF